MTTVTVDKRNHLIGFVALMHHPQKRKYTFEPYHVHCRSVAEVADKYCEFGFEIGMCHDLLEDTECTAEYLKDRLNVFGYTDSDIHWIVTAVTELTDVFTSENYPDKNRKERKRLEAERLRAVSYNAQTVKYADLIDNTSSIVKYDKGFAVKYLQEKEAILLGMDRGNWDLYKLALKSLKEAKAELLKT